jgi:ABC-2 type transport system permease protein
MIALVLQELRRRRTSIVWWIIGITAYNEINLISYRTIKDQAAQLNQVLDKLPETLKAFVAGSSDILSPIGYLNAKLYYLLLPLIFGILAIGLGSSLLSLDEQNHTIELLLSRPISRARLLSGKALAGLAVLGIVGVGTCITILFGASLGGLDVSVGSLVAATLLMLAFTLLLGSITFFLTALSRGGRRASIGIAVLVGLGGYIIQSLSGDVSWLKKPAEFFPYHYYRPIDALHGNGWLGDFFGFIIVAALLFAAAVFFFSRRDID